MSQVLDPVLARLRRMSRWAAGLWLVVVGASMGWHASGGGGVVLAEVSVHFLVLGMGIGLVVLGRRLLEREMAGRMAAEGLAREVLDSLPEHVAVLDEKGVIVSVNEAWRRFARENGGSGLPPSGIEQGANYLEVCRRASALVEDRLAGEALRGIEGVLSGGREGFDLEYPCDAPGCGRMFEMRVRPLRGRRAGVVVSHSEVTDQRRTEARLKQLSRAVEQSPVSIVITDARGAIVYVNPKFSEVTGYTAQEAIGQNPRILKSGEQPSEVYRDLWATISAGREWRGELHNRKKSGELYWEYASISAIRAADGQATHFVAVKEDITARRRMEEQLRQTQKMEAIGRLAGGVAHDFNNILAAGMMNVGLLKDEPGLGAEGQEILRELDAEFRRATGLTRQLLMFGRRSVLQIRELNLNDVIEHMLRMLGRLLGETVKLQFDPGPGLPGIGADVGMMEQVLMNLTVNARDAMPSGGRIRVSTQAVVLSESEVVNQAGARAGRFVRLTVSDEGSGMDEATRLRIFEPFYTTKSAGHGTGLGLATVYGIVEQHRGWVQVDSEVGRGSAFHIYLPVLEHPLAVEEGGGAGDVGPYSEQKVPRGTEVVLLVEDEGSVRRTLAQCLRLLGYRVVEAGSAEEAVAQWHAGREPVQLLFSDVVLPGGVSGLDLARRLRVLRPGLKVILSSGYPDAEGVGGGVDPRDAGIRYLPKPYPAEAVGQAVRACLDERPYLPLRKGCG